jgi:hypothetical protein
MIAPIVEDIHGELGDKVKVMKMDTDENPSTSMLGIMSIPTVIIFKDGKPTERTIGYRPEHNSRPEGQAGSAYLTANRSRLKRNDPGAMRPGVVLIGD